MADIEIGKKEKLIENSLQHYSADGVISTHEKFKRAALSFERISNTIFGIKNSLRDYWDGPAYLEFLDKFNRVFVVVRDLCDDLNLIQEILNNVQVAFYETDDSFDQQIRQAIYNLQQSWADGDIPGDRAVYEPNCPEALCPVLVDSPFPAKPMPKSTVGAAFTPDFSSNLFTAKPLINHCVPSPVMAVLVYSSLGLQDMIAHTTSESLNVVLNSEMLESKPDMRSTLGEAYFPSFYETSGQYKVVQNGILSAAVITIITQSLIDNCDKETLINRLGEAVLVHLNGDYPQEMHDSLMKQIGSEIYDSLYGDSAVAQGKTGINAIADQPAWADTLGVLIDDAVQSSYQQWADIQAADQDAELIPRLSFVRVVEFPGIRTMLGPCDFNNYGCSNEGIASFQGFEGISVSQAARAADQLADYKNGSTVRSLILQSVQKRMGTGLNAGSILFDTIQNVSPDSLTITIGAPASSSGSFSTLFHQDASGVSLHLEPVVNLAASFSLQPPISDFSFVQFPVPAIAV